MTGRSSILIDANLLVLFVVGSANRSLIRRHKRTSAFVEKDYDLLCRFIEGFTEVLITPNIVTEASNLLGNAPERTRARLLDQLALLIGRAREQYVASSQACQQAEFTRLGLADSTILDRAGTVSCVLTDDLDLYLGLSRHGHRVVNFNHLRQAAWDAE